MAPSIFFYPGWKRLPSAKVPFEKGFASKTT